MKQQKMTLKNGKEQLRTFASAIFACFFSFYNLYKKLPYLFLACFLSTSLFSLDTKAQTRNIELLGLRGKVVVKDSSIEQKELIIDWTATFNVAVFAVTKQDFVLAGSFASNTKINAPMPNSDSTVWSFRSTTNSENENELREGTLTFNVDNFIVNSDNAIATIYKSDVGDPSILHIIGMPNHAEGKITWLVSFSESVRNITSGNFRLIDSTGTLGTVPADTGDGNSMEIVSTHTQDEDVKLKFIRENGSTGNDVPRDLSEINLNPIRQSELTSGTVELRKPISTTITSQVVNSQIEWQITFGKSVDRFSLRNLAISAGELRQPSATGGTSITIISTHDSSSDGEITLTFNPNVRPTIVKNAAGNVAEPATAKQTIDLTPPTVTNILPTVQSVDRANNRIRWRVEFSEAVKNLSLANFSLVPAGGTIEIREDPATNLVPTTSRDIRVGADTVIGVLLYSHHTPENDGRIQLMFNGNSGATDLQNNILASDFTSAPAFLDISPPIATITSSQNGNNIIWNIVFDEPVRNFSGLNNFNISPAGTNNIDFTPDDDGFITTATITSQHDTTRDGEISLTFAADPASTSHVQDRFGNIASSATARHTIDLTPPTATIAPQVNGNTITWRVTFSEPMQNITQDKFTLSSGTLGTLQQDTSNSNIYTITSTHTNIQTATSLTFNPQTGTAASDEAGNEFAGSVVATNTPPTTTISSRQQGNNIIWDIVFSKPVKTFGLGSFIISPQGVNSIDFTRGQQFITQATITTEHSPTRDGEISLAFDADRDSDVVTDSANNIALDATARRTIDLTPPTLTINGELNRNTITWTLTFSEPVQNITQDKFILTGGGTLGTIQQDNSNNNIYTIISTHSTTGQTVATLSFDPQLGTPATDEAGNAFASSTDSQPITTDLSPPQLQSILPARIQNSRNISYTITFNEAVKNVSLDDFQLTYTGGLGGTAGQISMQNEMVYEFTLSINAGGNGDVAISLSPTNNIVDKANNPLAASSISETISFNSLAPTLESIVLTNDNRRTLTWRAQFNKRVKGVELADFLPNDDTNTTTTLANFVAILPDANGFASSWQFTSNTQGDGTISISFNKRNNDIVDRTGTALATQSQTSESVEFESVRPRVTITVETPTLIRRKNKLIYRARFSEPVFNVGANNFRISPFDTLEPVVMNVRNNNDNYRITFTLPTNEMPDTTISFSMVGIDTITDRSRLRNPLVPPTASVPQVRYSTDNTAPTLDTISAQINGKAAGNRYAKSNDTITYTLTFSENVQGIDSGDGKTLFALSNTTLNTQASINIEKQTEAIYRVVVTMPNAEVANSNTTFHLTYIGGNAIRDTSFHEINFAAGTNNALQTTPIEFIFDPIAPTTTISSTVNSNQIIWTVAFGESVSNILQNKFEISDGTLGEPSATSGESITIISTHNNLSDGEIFLTFTANAGGTTVHDLANNVASNAETSQQIIVNAPMATSITGTADRANMQINWVVSFSEPVENISFENFNISPGGILGVVPDVSTGNSLSFSSTHENSDDDFTLTFNAGFNARDLQGNNIIGSLSQTVSIDTEKPTTTIIANVESETIEWTVSFSEDIEELAKRHFSISTGTLGELVPIPPPLVSTPSASGTRVQIISTHDHTTDGTISLAFNANVGTPATDENNNQAQAAMQTATIDVPQTQIESINGTANHTRQTIEWTVVFSRPVENLTSNNFRLVAAGGTFTTLPTASTEKTLTIISTHTTGNDGDIQLMFDANMGGQDLAGNAIANDLTSSIVTIDTTPPTTTISSEVVGNQIIWTINFSEPIIQLAKSHFSISGGGTLGEPSATMGESIEIISTHDSSNDGTIMLTFNSTNGTTDRAGNPAQSATATDSIDATAPRIVGIIGTPNRENMQINWQVSFSESVRNINNNNFNLAPAGLMSTIPSASTGNSLSFTSTHTPENDGDIVLSFTPENSEDLQGNAVANSFVSPAVNLDISMPTTSISSSVNGNTIIWQINFDENVINVFENKFSLNKGTLSNLAIVSPQMATIESIHNHNNDGEIILTFTANAGNTVVHDDSQNIASNAMATQTININEPAINDQPNLQAQNEVENHTRRIANSLIQQFIKQQAEQYVNSMPILASRGNDKYGARNSIYNFQLKANNNYMNFKGVGTPAISSLENISIWFDSTYTKGDGTNNNLEAFYLDFGSDFIFSEKLTLGMFGKLDHSTLTQSTTKTELETKGWLVGSYILYGLPHKLNLASKIAYGESESEIKQNEILQNKLDMERLLFSVDISKTSYINTTNEYLFTPHLQYTYYSTKNKITKIELQNLELNLITENTFEHKNYTFNPSLILTGSYDLETNKNSNSKAELLLNFSKNNNINWRIGGNYDITKSTNNFKTYSINGGASIKF